MNNELIKQKSRWSKSWRWLVPIFALFLLVTALFFFTGMNKIAGYFAQAYTDTALYENALKIVQEDTRITQILGPLQPIDKFAILEGEVAYSNNNKTVSTSVRFVGTKGKARLDIKATRVDTTWQYTKIKVRITTPAAQKKTIIIIPEQ